MDPFNIFSILPSTKTLTDHINIHFLNKLQIKIYLQGVKRYGGWSFQCLTSVRTEQTRMDMQYNICHRVHRMRVTHNLTV